jgi:N utilization substance protein A
MSNIDMMEALQALAADKGISTDTLLGALADALESAYKRMPNAEEHAWVTIDPETFDIRVWAQDIDDDGEPYGPERDVTPSDFGRIAAQTAKQVMLQRIREVEREMKYEEYAGREGDIVTGIIQQSDQRYTLLDLGKVEALLPQAEQVPYERPEPNSRLKAYIVEVRKTSKGPQIVVSRTHPGLIKRLFELEVPEIADGVVEIKACAREPGHRTKIAVWSNDHNVDPVGACVGARGARVRMVVNELRGEKIDIVPFSDDPQEFIAKALSPAKVKEVRIDEETGTAEVIVPDYQLSLAIGKEGQNARLAARLSGWRVDIKSETQLAEEGTYQGEEWAEGEWVEDATTGEMVWQPAEGGPAMSAEQWEHGGADDESAPDAAPPVGADDDPKTFQHEGRGEEVDPASSQEEWTDDKADVLDEVSDVDDPVDALASGTAWQASEASASGDMTELSDEAVPEAPEVAAVVEGRPLRADEEELSTGLPAGTDLKGAASGDLAQAEASALSEGDPEATALLEAERAERAERSGRSGKASERKAPERGKDTT